MFCSSQSSKNHWQRLQIPLQWVEDKSKCFKGRRAQEFMVNFF